MKKTIKTIMGCVLTVLALASCNKAELPSVSVIPADNAVRFGVSGITVTTKADVAETLTASLDAGFDVAGFVNGTPDVKMFNELASKNSTWWETATHYYFPKTGTMDFIAAFPSKTGSVITEGLTGVYGIDYLNTENHDLVVASASDVAKTDLVPLTFDHVLSQVIVKMKGSNPDLTYKLESVGFEVPSEGFYVLRDETGSHASKVGKWQAADFIGKSVSNTTVRPVIIASDSFVTVSTDDYAKVGDSFVIMPGENVPLSVKWTCEDSAGNVVGEYDETVEIDELVMGKKTTLNVLLPSDATGIRFTAKANAWDNETKDMIMGPTAKHAVAASGGETVTLPKLRLDGGTEGYIVWGDGTREEFSNAATKAGSGVSYLVPEHEYTDDFTGDVKFYVKTGKITAGQFKDDLSYIIVDEMHAELEPVRALRFCEADQPTFVAFFSATGNQNLEYSYDGLEWQEWEYNNILDLAPALFGWVELSPEYQAQLMTSPESAGVLPIGPGLSALGFEDHDCVYVRGDNPTGLNHINPENADSSNDYKGIYYDCFFGTEISEGMFNPLPISLLQGVSSVTHLSCDGNVMHLLSYEEDMTGIPCDWCFSNLFFYCEDTHLYSLDRVPDLPATELKPYCYRCMFYGDASLTDTPELPATELAEGCYYEMFSFCTSLVDAPELSATQLAEDCYYEMFSFCTSLVNAPELPATELAEGCYYGMLSGCTSLETAPELPVTELAEYCYSHMFSGCTSLVNAPELPATQLAEDCYHEMFSSCTSLVNAPELPATELAEYCYSHMFSGCTSLVNAPELPATQLADWCYTSMFSSCTSLVNAPELPATQLAEFCYGQMFYYCTSLANASELPATDLAEYCYKEMFAGCTSFKIVTMKATDVSASDCLNGWLYGAGTSATNPTLYVDLSMVHNSYINSEKGVFAIASIGEPTPGVFTVNDAGKKVKFAPGNLYWNGSGYAFEEHQYDYTTEWDPNHVDRFYWSSSAEIARSVSYNDPGRTVNDTFFAADGGAIPGWTVLTHDEMVFIGINAIQRRDVEEDYYLYVIDGVNCIILLPDGYTKDILQDTYTAEEWAAAEAQYGLVALPFAGIHLTSALKYVGIAGNYWSCTPDPTYENSVYGGSFGSDSRTWSSGGRGFGQSVRLVSVIE